jgi:zinc transporter
MNESQGLIYASRLDGGGGGVPIGWPEIRAGAPDDEGLTWLHLDYSAPEARSWLLEESGLDPIVAEALLADETRPRVVPSDEGLLVILRGVNLNAGADPEDMVSIRLWIERSRVISLRRYHLMAVEDLKEALARGTGPTSAGEFLVALCRGLVARVGGVLEELDDEVDALEDEVLSAESHDLRPKLAGLRRRAIGMRRYLAPQREALARLLSERVSWLEEVERARLREIADRTTRYIEDLDSARDRAAVTQEELNNRLAEGMNQKMYVVALVAAIFLPLGLLTGLLGINVGGIPGAENNLAFLLVSLLLVGLAALLVWVLRRRHWL